MLPPTSVVVPETREIDPLALTLVPVVIATPPLVVLLDAAALVPVEMRTDPEFNSECPDSKLIEPLSIFPVPDVTDTEPPVDA